MEDGDNRKGRRWLIGLGLAALALLVAVIVPTWGPRAGARKEQGMQTVSRVVRPLPPMDLAAPAATKTATFALG